MGKLVSDIAFTGKLGNLSAYRMVGCDHIVVRGRGGPTREQVKHSPKFARTRENNAEFGGRSRLAGGVGKGLLPHKPVFDYSYAGALNKLARRIQELDMDSVRGKRHLILSKRPHTLAGFPLNRKLSLDTLIQGSIDHTLSRDTASAQLTLPTLRYDENFFPNTSLPLFQVVVSLAVVSDVLFQGDGYRAVVSKFNTHMDVVASPWYPVQQGAPAGTFELALPEAVMGEGLSLMLAMSVQFGRLLSAEYTETVRHVGAGKIVAMA